MIDDDDDEENIPILQSNSTELKLHFNSTPIAHTRVDSSSFFGLSLSWMDSKSANVFIGITLALLTAIILAMVMIVLKKLNNNKVHYTVAIVYACYCGLPFNIILSAIGELSGVNKPREKILYYSWQTILWQCGYSLTSAVFGTLSQIFVNISLRYEEASKISIVRTTDILFTFIFQIVVLNIVANFFSIIGAILILSATLLVMVYRLADKTLNKPDKQQDLSEKPLACWKRFIFFKF